MVRVGEWGDFLGTRQVGGLIREEAERALASSSEVVLDFGGVGMMSHSCADEAIGRLAASLGREAFRSRVRFVNLSADLVPVLRYVVAHRLSEARE